MNKGKVVYYASPLDRLTTSGNTKHPKQGDIMTRQRYDWNYQIWRDVISSIYGTPEADVLLTKLGDLSYFLRTGCTLIHGAGEFIQC